MVTNEQAAKELWATTLAFAACWQSRQPNPPAVAAMEKLLAEYPVIPARAGQKLRDWKYGDPGTFWSTAFHVLRSEWGQEHCAALRSAIRSFDDLADLLLDTRSLRRSDAVKLARLMSPNRPNLDIDLAARVKSPRTSGSDPDYVTRVLRVLDVIEAVSDPKRITVLVLGFRQVCDPRVISKVTLLLGRTMSRHSWIRDQLSHTDPRQRANAVEGLWQDGRDEETIQLLWQAVQDPHHRVVSNALVGLCRMGEVDAWELLGEMINHAQAPFRAAAAWAMGELGEPAFLDALHTLARTEKGSVRQNALKALVKIRRANPDCAGESADPAPGERTSRDAPALPAPVGTARDRGVLLED